MLRRWPLAFLFALAACGGSPGDPEDASHERDAAVRDDAAVVDSAPSPEDALQLEEIGRHVHEWMAQLNDKQRWVIERRFGLNGQEPCTLEDLAIELHVTRERVRQIQMESLRVLRQLLRRRGMSKDELF